MRHETVLVMKSHFEASALDLTPLKGTALNDCIKMLCAVKVSFLLIIHNNVTGVGCFRERMYHLCDEAQVSSSKQILPLDMLLSQLKPVHVLAVHLHVLLSSSVFQVITF
jgi:hypothetical protein